MITLSTVIPVCAGITSSVSTASLTNLLLPTHNSLEDAAFTVIGFLFGLKTINTLEVNFHCSSFIHLQNSYIHKVSHDDIKSSNMQLVVT